MDHTLSGVIYSLLSTTISLLQCCKEIECCNRVLNDKELSDLQKTIDKLGSNKTLEDLLLKKCTTKD